MRYNNKIQKGALILASMLLSLLLAECLLRLFTPNTNQLYVWQPNLSHIFYPDSTIFYGISGESRFIINNQGFRGKEFQGNSRKKYLCIGGSTTECLYLDNEETWPFHLAKLNTGLQIGSIGKSGCTTRENYLHLKYYTPQLVGVKGVIMMVGLNDMMKRLSRDSLFENDFIFTEAIEDSMVNEIFLSGKKEKSWWRKSYLVQLLQNTLHKSTNVEWKNVQDDNGEALKLWRNNRSNAYAIVDSVPDVTNALNEFERNLNFIYEEAQKQDITLILVTQATLYKDSMSRYENSLLWMGGIGNFQEQKNCSYYSPHVLNNLMNEYNRHLKNFCANKPDIKFIDLATQLPKDTSVFYDDCHFNENGARRVGNIISKSFSDSSK